MMNKRDGRRLVSLAEDAQRSVATFEAKVLDVGGTRLADPQPVEPEQHRERRMVTVVLLCGEQEHAELRAVETARICGVDLRAADVLGGVRPDPPVDVSESVVPADRREPPVDRRRRQAAIVHPRAEQASREPALQPAVMQRHAVFETTYPTEEFSPPAAWHIAALRDAGFAEVGLVWRSGPAAVIAAVR